MNQLSPLGALCAFLSVLVPAFANAAIVPLESRLGGQAWYDPNLDITWAADANINGADTWTTQLAWVAGLSIAGVSGWRLPSADVDGNNTVVDCTGGGVSGCADNEMGYLFWEEGITGTAPGPFGNLQSGAFDFYWSGTDAGSSLVLPWAFRFSDGSQDFGDGSFQSFAMAVRSGDVGAVPVPAAAWLFGSGLVGLGGIAHRRKKR